MGVFALEAVLLWEQDVGGSNPSAPTTALAKRKFRSVNRIDVGNSASFAPRTSHLQVRPSAFALRTCPLVLGGSISRRGRYDRNGFWGSKPGRPLRPWRGVGGTPFPLPPPNREVRARAKRVVRRSIAGGRRCTMGRARRPEGAALSESPE